KYVSDEQQLNLRCFDHQAGLQPVEDENGDTTQSRYVQGLMALRQDNPGLLLFAAIVGIADGLVPGADERVKDVAPSSLNDPPMGWTPQRSASPPSLRPACGSDSADGTADPARRIIKVAQGLHTMGASVSLHSICDESFTPALDGIIKKIADALGAACLP